MRIRFLLAWGNYPKGAIIDPPAATAGGYLATRFYGAAIAERVIEEPPPPPEAQAVHKRPATPARKGKSTRENEP